jgi:UDP-3-O-[3-hydroxymyristoyl] glucosamine N-acyltransferase
MAFTLDELVSRFGGVVVGDGNCKVTGLAPLDHAQAHQLSFLANPKYLSQVETTGAAAVLITPAAFETVANRDTRAFVLTPNPYAYFARVAQLFLALAQPAAPSGIHASAVIDPSAQVAASASIGAHVVIEAGAVIGEGVQLDAHVFVGQGSRLGAHTRLYPRVTIYHGCQIGERAIIHSGAVIGADGFGFAPDFSAAGGAWVKIPQVGGVRIGADVEIGANTTIDRGAMADTVIDDDVKIDNLVQIGHNCRIGAHTVIAGCTGIAGSTTLGRHCVIGGAVGIGGHLTLGDGVTVAGKSSVTKSLSQAGTYASTFPAIPSADWNRNAALMRNLDKMRARLKQLELALTEATLNSKA